MSCAVRNLLKIYNPFLHMKTKNFFCLDINFFKVFREILSATEERTLNGFLKSPFSYAYFISIVFPEQFQINFLPRNI